MGLDFPALLALLGNTLFVASEVTGAVSEYDATTGTLINASFVTGLAAPTAIAVK